MSTSQGNQDAAAEMNFEAIFIFFFLNAIPESMPLPSLLSFLSM